MAATTTFSTGRDVPGRTALLRYIIRLFAESGDAEDWTAAMVHEDIRSCLGVKDRRTWLKHLHGFERDRLLSVCYGKNQYAPTIVRAGEMLWHFEDKMLWHGYGNGGQSKPLRDSDAVTCLRLEADGVASTRTCHGAHPARTMARPMKTGRRKRLYAMALPANAMACEDAMAFPEEGQTPWYGTDKHVRDKSLQDNDAMACLRVETGVSAQACRSTSPVDNLSCTLKKKKMEQFHAMTFSQKNAMAYGNAMALSADCRVSWQENAMALSCRPDSGFVSNFSNVLYFSDFGKIDNCKYIINITYSKNTKIIKHQVRSVLSFTDSGKISEKVTHTHFCAVKTEKGRRKEKAGGGQLTRGRQTGGGATEATAGIVPERQASTVLSMDGSGNVWLQWVRDTAHTLSADENDFYAFSDRWLARAKINGKLAKYQTHSIKDFIIQDFMKEQNDKCNETAVAAAMQSVAACTPQARITQSSTSTSAAEPASMTSAGLRIPRGVKLAFIWGSLKDKQSELRGIAANYEYYLNKILLGRVQEVGLGTLMELHDIFRLNIPGYAARYPGIGHDDARGYKAAEEWICAAARAGYSPKNILQQAGFC